jgi:amino acid adenylation domain-containing protein
MGYLLQHLLVESAKIDPDKIAVIFEGETLTYGELDDLTNKVALVLSRQGVNRGDRVGIYLNKSVSSIVSIFGILKSGAVYVPIDPQAPVTRVSYIIDNCEIKCLLTSTAKAGELNNIVEKTRSLETVIFSDDKQKIPELSVKYVLFKEIEALKNQVLPIINNHSDLAYILYTSGSTGNPKGVMITHLNSLTFVNWAFHTMKVSSSDRFSSHAPLHFDLSIFDIFVAMKAGATLCLVPEKLSVFPTRLASWIEKHKISVWYSVPSVLSMMVTHGQLESKNFDYLKKVIFAGEVFPVKYLRDLMKKIQHPEYYNLYGPTETNVTTYYKVPKIPDDQIVPIPIGKCCENMEVFAVSKDGKRISKPGIEGELIARGTCVAKGYWGDPERTAKVFISNPDEEHFFDQAYRTGDLVSLDEQGNFIYKGRVDHMIKSRGYRIEIGEIEAALYLHPAVTEVAVIAIPDDLITNRIKAIIALSESNSITSSDIRMFCSEKLPKYMIPEIIEFRDKLPKTSTGKINKSVLLKEEV